MELKNEDNRRVFSSAGDVEKDDDFPIGMRVLAVDDDPVCLKVLETMLLRCQYHVTVTSRATDALEMLRERKDAFDLVITDVHMPDMDGFKLLELVGLEMDLPVIMLSVNSDKESVMRGITCGACNYLVKPVRIEELKNIWQHVVRRRFDPKNQNDKKINRSDTEAGDNCVTDEQQEQDQSRRHTRMRRAKNAERGYDSEENGQEKDDDNDSSAHKKPRVVWSQMLHQKFVDAVNLLGIDKAVPKKVLEIMDVEGLTRENVASHLQKYRQCLKKLSNKIIQPDDMLESMGGVHSFATRASSIDDLRNNYYRFPESRQPSSELPFLQQHGGCNRLMNTAAGLSSLTSSGSGGFQIGQMQRVIGLPSSHDPWKPPQYGISRIRQSFERNQCYRSKPLPQGINTTFLRSPSYGRFPSSNPDYSLLFQ